MSMNGRQGPNGTPPSVMEAGTGKDGSGDWQDYTQFRQKVFEPVFREIHDRFKYANLEDPDRQQLVAMLADLGDMQLGAACNQFTKRVQSLHEERDAIMEVLATVGMPSEKPAFGADGRLLDRVLNPLYEPVKPLAVEGAAEGADMDGEEVEAGGELVVYNGEPEFLDYLPMSLSVAIDVDREGMAEAGVQGIWYVPLTPAECYDRLEDVAITLRLMFEDRARAMRGGYFYDSGPLLAELEKSPDLRKQGDISWMYPFFYRQCFRICAITPEDLHGHIQAVNADQIQERHGGNFMSPKQMQEWAKQQGQGNG